MTYKTKRSLAQRGKHAGQEAQGAPSRRGAGARDQALPLRLAGASRRRRAAALGARPRALTRARPTSTRSCAHSRRANHSGK